MEKDTEWDQIESQNKETEAKTHALQRFLIPVTPFRHSGLDVVPQNAHCVTPAGGFPETRPPFPAPLRLRALPPPLLPAAPLLLLLDNPDGATPEVGFDNEISDGCWC